MGEVLGIGVTHYPPLASPDEKMADLLRWTMEDPDIPADAKDPASWPPEMRAEYGDDGGIAAAGRHRDALRRGLAKCRAAIDEFAPDVVVIWGDDQYENFHKDLIPAFSVLAYEEIVVTPWSQMFGFPNVWDEPKDKLFTFPGHRDAGRYLAGELLSHDYDVAYAYEPLHHRWGHAFTNTVLYLDYERRGWPYPCVGFHVNCYGRSIVRHKGSISRFADRSAEPDPPSPSPSRCYAIGRATARAFVASPWRVALVASSSWSHAFLTDKTWRLRPDLDSDRRLYQALAGGDYEAWHNVDLAAIEDAGQQELLNWFCLVGAMDELARRPTHAELVETFAFNSNKCFAIFEE
jgi:hypothetical protein